MLSSTRLKEIVSEARPYIERQMDDAVCIAAFRDVVAAEGGDWSALKALIKAQIKDERDETGKRGNVRKILDKAEFSSDYAELLGWSNMNEQNFSAGEDHDPETGEILVDEKADCGEEIGSYANETGRFASSTSVEEVTHSRPSPKDENATASDVPPAEEAVADIQPETAQQAEPADAAVTAGNDLREPVAAEQGQIVREGDAPRETGHQNDADERLDDGDASRPNAEFEPARKPEEESPSQVIGDMDRGSFPVGGSGQSLPDDAPVSSSLTGQGGGESPVINLAMTRAEKVKALRPHCLRPEACRSSGGKDHCFSCRSAMSDGEGVSA